MAASESSSRLRVASFWRRFRMSPSAASTRTMMVGLSSSRTQRGRPGRYPFGVLTVQCVSTMTRPMAAMRMAASRWMDFWTSGASLRMSSRLFARPSACATSNMTEPKTAMGRLRALAAASMTVVLPTPGMPVTMMAPTGAATEGSFITVARPAPGPQAAGSPRRPGAGPTLAVPPQQAEIRVVRRAGEAVIEELPGGITLVGTAHVAASSVAEVESVLRERRPKQVLVELDARRLEALRDPEAWRKTDVVRILKEGKQHLFLLQLYLASMQAQMGRDTGVAPGAELLRAVQVADEIGAQVVLIDRDIAITLKRGFGALGFWTRLKLFWHLWMELMTPAAGEEKKLDVEALLKSDAITKMTEEFARVAPPIKTALIDERDDFMASHIAERAAAGQIGRAH